MRLQGYNGQKASISKTLTITVKQIGHAILRLDQHNEEYLITLPALHIEGVYSGAPYVELNSSSYIQSTSGYTTKVDYSGKGWLSGKKNSFTATVYPEGKPKDVTYHIDGQWSEAFRIRDSKKNEIDSFDSAKTPTSKLIIAPIEEQHPVESRRAWQKVATGISKGDMDTTSAEKTKIENEQRELRKKEKEENREWERKFFTRKAAGGTRVALAKKVNEIVDGKGTDGVWEWDEAKAKTAVPTFPK